MAVSVLDDLYNNLKKNNNSAQKSTSAAKTNTTPVSTKKTTTVSSNSGKTTTTTKTSNSLINTIKNFFSGLNQKASASMSNYNPNSGVYTSSAGSYSNNPNTSTYSNVAKQTVKAYDQPFTSSGTNYTTVPKAITTQKAYNEPFTSDAQNVKKADAVNNALVNLNRSSVQNALKQTAASIPESKVGKAVASGVTKISNGVSDIYNGLVQKIDEKNLAKTNEKLSYVQQKNQQMIDSAKKEDLQQLFDQNGQMIDYSETIQRLKNRKSMLESSLESNPNAKIELEQVKKDLERYDYLNQLRSAIIENTTLQNLDDSEESRAYKEQLSHKYDNFLERGQNAINHLVVETANIVPMVLDQAREGGNTQYAMERLDELKQMKDNGSITDEEYKDVLEYWNDYIETSRAMNEDNLSQKIRSVSDQISANTYYGASDIEKFVLQAGESTAQFMLHYVIGKGIAGALTNPAELTMLGSELAAEMGYDAASLSASELMQFGLNKAAGNVSLITMSTVSGTQKINQLLSQGVDYNTAVKNGILTGYVSYLTEHLPIENYEKVVLGGAGEKVTAHIMNSLFTQSLNEGLEELAEGFLDPLVDSLTLGTKYEVDGTELLSSFLLGAASGAMGGAITGGARSLNIKISSKMQMNMLQNEINALNEVIPTMSAEYQIQARTLVQEAQKKISEFREVHPFLDSYHSEKDDVQTTSVREDVNSIYEALAPDFNQEVQENRALDQIRNVIQSEAVRTELNEISSYEKALNLQGVTYDQLDFDQLSDDQKINTNVTAEVARSLNRDVLFAELNDKYGNVVDGVFVNGKIIINPKGNRGALSTMIHEYTHGLEASKYYNRLKGFIKRELGSNYDAALEKVKDAYSDIKGVDYEKELVAIRSQDLLANEDFVKRLVKYNSSLATRLYEDIKNLVTLTDSVQDIEYNFMRAFADQRDVNNDVVQLSVDEKGNKIIIDEQTALQNATKVLKMEPVYDVAGNRFSKENGKLSDTVKAFFDSIGNHVYRDGLGNIELNEHGIRSLIGHTPRYIDKYASVEALPEVLRKGEIIRSSENWKNRNYDSMIIVAPITIDASKTGNKTLKYMAAVVTQDANENNEYYLHDLVVVDPEEEKKLSKSNQDEAKTSMDLNNYTYTLLKKAKEINDGKEMVELSKGTQLEDLGRQKDLLAIHNLSEEKLMKALDLGGLVMPSIAITKSTIPHEGFGSISLVFDKNTVDPKRRDNRVFKRDAWTPTFPDIDRNVSFDDVQKIYNRLSSVPMFRELYKNDSDFRRISDSENFVNLLDNHNGDPVDAYRNNNTMKMAYLLDKGTIDNLPMRERRITNQMSNDDVKELIHRMGVDRMLELNDQGYQGSLDESFIWNINQIMEEKYGEKDLFNANDDSGKLNEILYGAVKYITNPQDYQLVDSSYFGDYAEQIDQQDYEDWLKNNIFKDLVIEEGLRNDKDYYYSDGRRRTFKQLHDPVTPNNILKRMKAQSPAGSFGWGSGYSSVLGAYLGNFNSIREIIDSESNLEPDGDYSGFKMFEEMYNKLRDEVEAASPMAGDVFAGHSNFQEAASNFANSRDHSIQSAQRYFAENMLTLTDEQAARFIDLLESGRELSTDYYEAKPARIVTTDEIQTAVIPVTASDAIRQRLSDLGINTVEYDPEAEYDRTYVMDGLENLKFSKGVTLEDLNDQARREFRNLDLASRRVNLKEDINSAIDDIVYNGEVSEVSYNALRQDVIRSTMQQMDNPAWEVARDIRKTLGNNFGTLPRDGWDAIIADINDQYNLFDENYRTYNTYEDAQEFIKDYLSRAGEKYIYMSPVETGDISEQEYEAKIDQKLDQVITMLKEGVANRINQTAIDNTLADALGLKDDSLYYQEMEDLAYQRGQQDLDALMSEDEKFLKAYEEATAGNYSPEALQQLEDDMVSGVTIDQAKEETSVLKEVKKDTSKPIRTLKDIFYQVRQKIFDKGIAIRDLKNSKLSASYDMLLNAENRANYTILEGGYDENGHKVVDSLTEISKMIPEAQKNDFDYYMYHKHNIDAAKIGKPVFFNFNAAKSQQIVNQYEMAHPEWKDVAQKYYDYNDYLLKRQVDAGVITQQTADIWKQLYPHYVPTKRVLEQVDEGALVELADPQVESANKGTLYERTGGNSPIQPLDYAMAEHTKQIYKSSLFNEFAKDYIDATHATKTLFNEDSHYNEDVIEGKEEQITKADEYTPATLIYYEDGDRNIVEIPQNIYDAIGPSQTPFNLPSSVPFLNWASSMRRNMITGANPVFWATNGLKDLQDIAFNSKYSLSTYMNLPRAYKQLLTNGEIANLYKSLGGDYNSYRSEEGVDQNDHSAFYNATIGKVVQLNDLIETAPRLAEFMSSLDHGDSLETAMYNAAEVTTNFKRGGDYAKWLNRNEATFLNASIQGFDKQIRNVADAYDSKGWKGVAGYMVKANLLAGIPLIVINGLLHRDDKDYDQLSDYIKDNYYILWKYDDGKFVRIPKGRIANAYQGILTALYENGVELVGDDKAIDKAKTIWENTLESLKNVWEQVGINDVGGNNIFSPIVQTIKNEAWYGDPIVSTYMQKKNPEDQYDESTDLFSVWLGQKTKLSPKKINYLIDQYSGGVGDVILPMLTPKAETGFDDGTVVGKLTSAIASPFADKFTTDSVFKNQDVTDFFALDEELTKLANKEHASDEAKLASKYINSLQYQMNDLYAQKRQIYNDNSIPDSLKYDKAREVQRQIDALARFGLDTYDQIDMDGYYADLNGVSYYRNTKGEWSKVDQDKEAELDALNLTTKEKSDYFYVKNNISELREQVKADTSDGQDADYRAVTLDAIMNSDLTPRVQNLMYDSYYSGKITDNINGMDLTDEEKLALKMANATASSVKDANGKTISNSKALGIADAYADAGLLDDVFSYIAANGLAPSDFGLTKTVYGYSYDKMASEYQKIYGETFGTGSTQNVDLSAINNKTSNSSSSGKKSSGKKKTGTRRSSSSSSSSKAQKAAEKARKKQLKALQKAAKALRKGNKNIFDVLNKMTSIQDAEANVKKIMQNAYKG